MTITKEQVNAGREALNAHEPYFESIDPEPGESKKQVWMCDACGTIFASYTESDEHLIREIARAIMGQPSTPAPTVRGKHMNGGLSKRCYTEEEIAAAERLGLADRNLNLDPTGSIFWGTGTWVRDTVAKILADYQTVAAAVEREWPNIGIVEGTN